MSYEVNTLKNTLDHAYEMIGLKDVQRTGWVLRGVRNPESVADHSWGTALLALLFLPEARRADGDLDRDRVLAIAIVHDLAEVRTGDIPRRVDPGRDRIGAAEKAERERRALLDLAGSSGEISELWEEYEAGETLEARYVRDMNLVDMCLQALRYETEKRYDPEVGAEEFPDYPRMEEFFATAGPRFSTITGRDVYDELWRRYQNVVDQVSGKTIV